MDSQNSVPAAVVGIQFLRSLRTPSSERFIIHRSNQDVAAVDLHFRPDGVTDGTVTVFNDVEGGLAESEVPQLLEQIDEILLPHGSLQEQTVAFTVVIGRVLGAFVPESSDRGSPRSI